MNTRELHFALSKLKEIPEGTKTDVYRIGKTVYNPYAKEMIKTQLVIFVYQRKNGKWVYKGLDYANKGLTKEMIRYLTEPVDENEEI